MRQEKLAKQKSIRATNQKSPQKRHRFDYFQSRATSGHVDLRKLILWHFVWVLTFSRRHPPEGVLINIDLKVYKHFLKVVKN